MMGSYYIASCSCGKDSLAMVLKLIFDHKPLDEIVFYDTGMEFMAIYKNWYALKSFAEAFGIKCTVLKPKCPFEFKMFDKPVNVGKPNEHKGYSWCGGRCRWGTTEKLTALDRYCEEKNAFCRNNVFQWLEYSPQTATGYAWFVWEKGFTGDTTIKWIN